MLVKSLFGFFGDLFVHRAEEGGQAFEDGDFSAQASPHRTHFQANHARANEGQFLGYRAHTQSAVIGQHIDFVKRCTGQGTGARSCGDDDVFGSQGLFGFARHLDFIACIGFAGKRTTTMEERDFVFLEQEQDAVVVLLDHGVFAFEHLRHVHLHPRGSDAVLSKVVVGLVKMLRRLQQGLGGNAAHIGTGAARCWATSGVLPFIDTRDLKAQLGSADGGDVATRPRANDDDVEWFAHVDYLKCQTANVLGLPRLPSWRPVLRQLRGRQ